MTPLLKDNIDLVSLAAEFGTDEKCRECVAHIRWPNGPRCPRCNEEATKIANRDQYDCNSCHYQFSVTAGTIFHDSHLSLWKWFLAAYLMTESKKGISANQIGRILKLSYKTAWYLCHRIRKAVEEAKVKPQLNGVVEVDETYVGGRYDRRRKRRPWEKQAVMGLLQRNGNFESRTIPTASRQVLTGVVKDRINKKATVFTDELAAYKSLDKTHKHATVNHSEEEWVRGQVHTNGIENAWSLFKRSIVGSYHKLSVKHMDAYLDEFEWRFNNRSNPYLFRDTLVKLIKSEKLEYKELTSKAS
jgi:transposase-like protein